MHLTSFSSKAVGRVDKRSNRVLEIGLCYNESIMHFLLPGRIFKYVPYIYYGAFFFFFSYLIS